MIRKLKREGRWNDAVDIVILSAKFGLIGPDEPIPYYDQTMSSERARELRESVSTSLAQIFSREVHSEVFCHLGPTYLEALPTEFLSLPLF